MGAGETVVTGCWSTLNPQAAAALPGVVRVIPNLEKDQLVPAVLGEQPVQISETFDHELLMRVPVPGARLRTRAFIKVQDGCDNHCTFCITTLARGAGRSRLIAEVLADVRLALAGPAQGAQEIVLTGVHLGSWGQDFPARLHLADLVRAVLQETDVPRLRLSSLEPWDLDEGFFQLWRDERLCRHLHLPLQSGCAATLRRMARKTTPDIFKRLVEAARLIIPDVAITTDLIAGFPGESEAEFAQTLAFVRQMNFADGHVFTYSERPGTAAARMPGVVPLEVRKQRNAALRQVLEESASTYQRRFIGRELGVLWESATALGPQGWRMSGLTDNYLRVFAHAPQSLWNHITPVRLAGVDQEGIHGFLAQA
jgi:threonylcarbamoyladenosine tRNA methylthiotransferase MtaB